MHADATRPVGSRPNVHFADHAPIIVTRKASSSVVMMSLDDYEALEETAYLLRSPKNARRLLEAIAELEAGGGIAGELAE